MRTLIDDKIPFRLIIKIPFRLIICGQRFARSPAIFDEARSWLAPHTLHWGFAESAQDYRALFAELAADRTP